VRFSNQCCSGASVAVERVALARPEEQIDLVTVVGPTPQLDVLDGRPPSSRMRDDVVELDEPALAAAAAAEGNERASAAIS